jgi:putative DNA methylase
MTQLLSRHAEPRPPSLPRASLIERRFPFRELSELAQAERRATESVYAAHRWWARRSPAVFRGILLSAALPDTTSSEAYWTAYDSDSAALGGVRVHDPFVGGGTTLVEACRLGADVSGGDIDPLAVEIVANALDPADPSDVAEAGAQLLDHLGQQLRDLWPSIAPGRTPIHYFYLSRVECPACRTRGLLYRSLVIARDTGKPGGVIRDNGIAAFCPVCLGIHNLPSGAHQLDCCGEWPLESASYVGQRYRCPTCDRRSHRGELLIASAERVLLAVEETADGRRRLIRSPVKEEHSLDQRANAFLASHLDLPIPNDEFARERSDPRPISFGITRIRDCFTNRQLALFGVGFQWVRGVSLDPRTRRALELALSNALATNNKLCGYATDYGRLAPLFSVRSYAMPWLAVELNPLHPTAGRGSIQSAVRHARMAAGREGRRYVWDPLAEVPVPRRVRYPASPTVELRVSAASDPRSYPPREADVAVFDPPYFDFIAYSELSEFYRPWLRSQELGGAPLHPQDDSPVESFGVGLGDALMELQKHVTPRAPMVFTYHSSRPEAWQALGLALDRARLAVTCLWPVRSDPQMGHHSGPGNCEWDLVIGVRPLEVCEPGKLDVTTDAWLTAAAPFEVSQTDLRNFELALGVARPRFAYPVTVAG